MTEFQTVKTVKTHKADSMPILSLEEVSALKIQLENHTPDSELYASPLDKAILHLLTAAELGVLKGERLRSLPGARLAGHREEEEEEEEAYLEDCLNFDALGLAIDWIHQKCRPNASKQTVRSIDEGTLVGAKKLLSVAARLALFSNYLAMAKADCLQLERSADGVLHGTLTGRLNKAANLAEKWLHRRKTDESELSKRTTNWRPEDLYSGSRVNLKNGSLCYDEPSTDCIRELIDIIEASENRWDLDPEWKLKDYKLSEFRRFWNYLLSRCTVHQLLHHLYYEFRAAEEISPNGLIMIKKRHWWLKELSAKTGFSKILIDRLLRDTTYDSSLYARDRIEKRLPRASIGSQPFFDLGGDMIALSNLLVTTANPEQQIWNLFNVLASEEQSAISKMKEGHWLKRTIPFMNNLGLSAFGSVETINKVGDIDLLIIDENDSLALVCEFKWTTGADSFDHLTGRVRSAITKAMDQLEKRLAWIESDPEKLADRVGIDGHLARKLEYKGLVIMFDTIGGGLFSDPPYPIIEARYLEFILGAPHNKSLRILWQVADKQRFLPIEKKHFVHLDRTIELDDMVLKLKGVDCCLTDEQWIADRDIDFKGLS